MATARRCGRFFLQPTGEALLIGALKSKRRRMDFAASSIEHSVPVSVGAVFFGRNLLQVGVEELNLLTILLDDVDPFGRAVAFIGEDK